MLSAAEAREISERNHNEITRPYLEWAIKQEATNGRRRCKVYGEEFPDDLYEEMIRAGFTVLRNTPENWEHTIIW